LSPTDGSIESRWADVERYFGGLLFPPDAALDAALADSVAAGLPPINVSAAQGRLLAFFARMIQARRILEIGTLGGYTTDAKVQGVRQFNLALAAERRVEATAIQLVGAKGYDGIAVMIVKDADA
jgi:predicted O-methyltransferase YrrM